MERENPIRVLIVDDNAFVREGLAAIVGRQQDMEVVAEAVNGEEAIGLFRRHQPDATLMDLRMPVMNGIEATQAIRDEFPGACILILTTFAEEDTIARALRAGAAGYVLKDAPIHEILEAVRAMIEAAVSTAIPQAEVEYLPL